MLLSRLLKSSRIFSALRRRLNVARVLPHPDGQHRHDATGRDDHRDPVSDVHAALVPGSNTIPGFGFLSFCVRTKAHVLPTDVCHNGCENETGTEEKSTVRKGLLKNQWSRLCIDP